VATPETWHPACHRDVPAVQAGLRKYSIAARWQDVVPWRCIRMQRVLPRDPFSPALHRQQTLRRARTVNAIIFYRAT